MLLIAGRSATSVSSSRYHNYEESWIEGSAPARTGRVAVIDLWGIISYGVTGQLADSMVDDVIGKLHQARDDGTVKVIVLRIDSPGGEVTASDVLYHEIKKVNEVKPVIAYIETLGASGAYYAAMGARHVMANELALTGSIGVIIQTYNVEGLTEKIGVSTLTFKSGEMKDLLNPTRPATMKERAYVQDLVDGMFDRFLNIVAESRGLDAEELRGGNADGRILRADTALEGGLLDSTGYFEDALNTARELGDLDDDAQVVRLLAPFTFARFLRSYATDQTPAVRVQIGPELPVLEPGKMYYISPHLYVR